MRRRDFIVLLGATTSPSHGLFELAVGKEPRPHPSGTLAQAVIDTFAQSQIAGLLLSAPVRKRETVKVGSSASPLQHCTVVPIDTAPDRSAAMAQTVIAEIERLRRRAGRESRSLRRSASRQPLSVVFCGGSA